jgi:hypothetical protein
MKFSLQLAFRFFLSQEGPGSFWLRGLRFSKLPGIRLQKGVLPYIVNLFVYESGSDSKRASICGKLRFFPQDQRFTSFLTCWKKLVSGANET